MVTKFSSAKIMLILNVKILPFRSGTGFPCIDWRNPCSYDYVNALVQESNGMYIMVWYEP